MHWAITFFEAISGQRINTDKSGIMFSNNTTMEGGLKICDTLKISEVRGHGKYLGLPSEVGQNKTDVFEFLKEKIRSRLDGWSERNLSKARKEILIKSVLQAIPSYAIGCFSIPDNLLK